MNTSKNLTIASLVLGGVGALLFIIYKVRGAKKSSLMANGSKLLIAIGIILLAIAVLLLSEDREPYSTKGTDAKLIPPDSKKKYFLTKISGLAKNTLYSITANDGVLLICKSDEKGEINIQKLVRDSTIPGLPMPFYQDMRIRVKDEIAIGNPKGDYVAKPGKIHDSFTLVGREVSKDNKVVGCVYIKYGVAFMDDGRVSSIGVITIDPSTFKCPEN